MGVGPRCARSRSTTSRLPHTRGGPPAGHRAPRRAEVCGWSNRDTSVCAHGGLAEGQPMLLPAYAALMIVTGLSTSLIVLAEPVTEPKIQLDWNRKLQVRRPFPWASRLTALEIFNRCHQAFSSDVTGSALGPAEMHGIQLRTDGDTEMRSRSAIFMPPARRYRKLRLLTLNA